MTGMQKSAVLSNCTNLLSKTRLVKSVIFLALLLFSIPHRIDDPEFIDARNFRLGSIGLKETIVQTDLYYFNPNGISLNLKEVDMDVYLNGRYAGHSFLDTMVHIPSRDTFFVPVSVKVDMKSVFPNALTLLMNDSIELRIEGKLKLGRAGLFINVPVKYRDNVSIR